MLIKNLTKTFNTFLVLINPGCHVTVVQARDLYRINKSVKKTDKNDSIELAAYMCRRLHGENEFTEYITPSKKWMIRRKIYRTISNEKSHF